MLDRIPPLQTLLSAAGSVFCCGTKKLKGTKFPAVFGKFLSKTMPHESLVKHSTYLTYCHVAQVTKSKKVIASHSEYQITSLFSLSGCDQMGHDPFKSRDSVQIFGTGVFVSWFLSASYFDMVAEHCLWFGETNYSSITSSSPPSWEHESQASEITKKTFFVIAIVIFLNIVNNIGIKQNIINITIFNDIFNEAFDYLFFLHGKHHPLHVHHVHH